VSPLAVIKTFDEPEDFALSISMRLEPVSVDALDFERAKKGFRGGIVIAAALTTHAG
jgi:hypothetical protein